MKTKKYISRLLNLVFIMVFVLFVLDAFTSFEIKNQTIKSFSYFGLMLLSPLVLFWNLRHHKTRKSKLAGSMLPILSFIVIITIGPQKIIASSPAWKTQTVIYQNGHLSFYKVEFQMQDLGALGYNKRKVEVTYLTDLFMIVEPVQNDIDKRVEWVKVDKEINELGIK